MLLTSPQDYSSDDTFEHLEDLVSDMRSLIDRMQHPIRDIAWLEKMQKTGEELAAKVSGLANIIGEKQVATSRTLRLLADRLKNFAVELAAHPTPNCLIKHRDILANVYEEFLIELRKRRIEGAAVLAQTNHLRPVNYSRNIFHVSMAVFGVACYLFFLTKLQALAVLGSITALFGSLEIIRRFSKKWNDFLCDKIFKSIIRPSERYKVNSATIYVTALFTIVLLFPKTPVLAATLILGFSDPVASLVGKRWGKMKFYRDKSLIGSLSFFITGFIVASLFIYFVEPSFALSHVLFVSAIMAFSGMLAELFSGFIDDNFAVPVVCAFVGTLII